MMISEKLINFYDFLTRMDGKSDFKITDNLCLSNTIPHPHPHPNTSSCRTYSFHYESNDVSHNILISYGRALDWIERFSGTQPFTIWFDFGKFNHVILDLKQDDSPIDDVEFVLRYGHNLVSKDHIKIIDNFFTF